MKRRDYAYCAVIIWALIGISLKRMTDDPVYGIQTQIAYTAISTIIVILVIATISGLLGYAKKD
jgi:hypothetical protein